MRWRATLLATHLASTVVGLMKRPDQIVVTLQSAVHVLEVSNTTRGP
jgi:hypothetical protein